MLDRLCDILTFGALEACDTCTNGQLVYQSGKYLSSHLLGYPLSSQLLKLVCGYITATLSQCTCYTVSVTANCTHTGTY